MDTVKNLMETEKNSISSMLIDLMSGFHAAVEEGDESTVEAILEADIDIEATNKSGLTALMTAVKQGNKPIIKLLLEYGADIGASCTGSKCFDTLGLKKTTILHYAVEHVVDDSIINMLLTVKRNLELAPSDIFVESLLKITEYAVQREGSRLLKYLLGDNEVIALSKSLEKLILLQKTPAIDIQTQDNYSALLLAIKKKRIQIVKSLLENGASLHRVPSYHHTDGHVYKSCTMLHMTALWYNESQDEEIVRLLIDHGEDINATTECNLTALLIAIQNNNFELVKILVSLGADINKKVYDGLKSITLIPLHQALQHHDGRIFKYLLDTKKVDKKDLQSAAVPVIHCTDPKNKAEILLQSFLSDDYKYPESDSMVLNLAIIAKNQTVIDSFIARNDSNVSLMKWRGQYPIHRAAKSNNIDCIIRLLSLEAEIDIKDELGRTALHYAARKLNTRIAYYLLRRGANVLALNNKKCHRWLELNIIWHKTKFIEQLLEKIPEIFHFYTPLPDEYFATLVMKYTVKSSTANISFDQYYLCWREFSSQNTTEKFSSECTTEIDFLKQEKICMTSYLTYHHFLTNDVRRLVNYVRNTNVTSNFNPSQVRNKFPIYGQIITYSYSRARRRLTLILNFESVLADILCHLPTNFVRMIPDYLSNEDLRILTL